MAKITFRSSILLFALASCYETKNHQFKAKASNVNSFALLGTWKNRVLPFARSVLQHRELESIGDIKAKAKAKVSLHDISFCPLSISRGGERPPSTPISNQNEKIEIDTDNDNGDIDDRKDEKNMKKNDTIESDTKGDLSDISSSTSLSARDWITAKADEFILTRVYNFPQDGTNDDEDLSTNTPTTPQKLLHQIAKKLPPIKKSPDYLLKIRSASVEDAGNAAFSIGVIAGATDLFEKNHRENQYSSSSSEFYIESVVKDRRWEQIVECVLCGVDVRKRMQELETLLSDSDKDSESAGTNSNVEAGITSNEADSSIGDGLDVADASRAAWGLAILGVQHYVQTLGGETPNDIFNSLSLRCRDVLNSQWKRLSDMSTRSDNIEIESSIINKWDQSKENLARDAARSMWAFACVKACTNVRSDYLFSTCCNILRGKLISQKNLVKKRLEEEDVLERLAKVAEEKEINTEENTLDDEIKDAVDSLKEQLASGEMDAALKNITDETFESNSSLLQLLTPLELVNVIWALAVHNHDINKEHANDRIKIKPSDVDIEIEEHAYDVKIVYSVSNQILTLLQADLFQLASRESIIASNSEKKREIDALKVMNEGAIDENCSKNETNEAIKLSNSTTFSKDTHNDLLEDKSDTSDHVALYKSNKNKTNIREEKIVEIVDAAALLTGDHWAEREILQNATTVQELIEDPEQTEDSAFSDVKSKSDSDMSFPEDENREVFLQASSEEVSSMEVVDAASLISGDGSVQREIIHMEKDGEPDKNKKIESIEVDEFNLDKASNQDDSNNDKILLDEEDYKEELEQAHQSDDNFPSTDHLGMNQSTMESVDKDLIPIPPIEISFTIRDLCSIAWAVTEVQWRPSSKVIDKKTFEEYEQIIHTTVAIITKITQGASDDEEKEIESIFEEAELLDLSNLAWAMAKIFVKDSGRTRRMTPVEEENIMFVVHQIVHWSGIRLKNSPTFAKEKSVGDNDIKKKDPFIAPTILSRLMWSLATIHREAKFKNKEDENVLTQLFLDISHASIREADANLSLYRVEDLARIVWAYAEFSGVVEPKGTVNKYHLNLALGRFQNAIESSLLRWELGRCSEEFDKQSIWNIPMFERSSSSLHLKKLESSRTSAADEDRFEEDDKNDENQPNRPGRRLLPSLKSLPIDPSTLCKVSFAFTKIADMSMSLPSTFQLNFGKGAEELARIAARIFTYSSESLLSQCYSHDIAKLCYAYTRSIITATISLSNDDRSMCNSETREALTRHFTKRVVRAINDSMITIDSKSVSLFDTMAPNDLSSLLWSLGELGVQCGSNLPGDEKRLNRYKRIRLSAKRPVLTLEQLQEMTPSSTLNLLHGIIGLDDIASDIELLQQLLGDMDKQKLTLYTAGECCRAVHTITKLKNFLLDIYGASVKSNENDKGDLSLQPSKDSVEISSDTMESANEDKIVEETDNVDISKSNDAEKKTSNLLTHCDIILSALAERIIVEVPHLSASQLRKILQAYFILPFQADDMVNHIEEEVKHRLSTLEAVSAMSSESSSSHIKTLIQDASDYFVNVASILAKIKSKNEQLFTELFDENDAQQKEIDEKAENQSSNDSQTSSDKQISNVIKDMNSAVAAVCEATTRLERLERGSRLSLEPSIRVVENGAAFELGRCLELIDGYRLLEFQLGTQRRRFTGEKKKNIGKRIFSRLFQ